ncbi:MAG: dynamin family protein, partial [Rhodoferax sp.]|nr:dynamin family protein [Rhodoferax sp.]
SEQKAELQGLGGKNSAVIKNMRQRIEQEKLEFDIGNAKIHAVRSVQHKLLGDVFTLLGSRALKAEMAALATALQRPGIKLNVKGVYGETFTRLRGNLERARANSLEIQTMLAATFRQLNAEYGFSLQAPSEPDVARFDQELRQIEQSHLRYLGLTHALRLAQPEFADRLVRALATRLRAVYEAAFAEVEIWSKTAAGQLESQLQERRTSFSRRIEAIDRIQQAAGGLDERVAEIETQEAVLGQLETRLQLLTSYFLSTGAALQTGDGPADATA